MSKIIEFPATADLIMAAVISGKRFIDPKAAVPTTGIFYVVPCLHTSEVAAYRHSQFPDTGYSHVNLWQQVVGPLIVSQYADGRDKEVLREAIKDLWASIPFGYVTKHGDSYEISSNSGTIDKEAVADQFFITDKICSNIFSISAENIVIDHEILLKKALGPLFRYD